MTHDIDSLKAANPLMQLMSDDGHILRKLGGTTYTCLCPFHTEKTPSCRVDTHRQRYHCFGCGAKGDVVEYVQQTRNLEKKAALDWLADKTPGHRSLNYTPPKPAQPEPTASLEPLKPALLTAWQIACEKLVANEREIQRIAEWRGFHPDTIRGAASAGLMAKWDYFRESREAFLVLAPHTFFPDLPAPESPTFLPHAIHCRLSAHSAGNPHPKQSWRYDPKGSKAWPFLWGDAFTARWIFITEGQWDALALADLCGWHRPDSMPPQTVIIGLRGATSWKLMLHADHGFPLSPEASCLCISDADNAGNLWFDKDGFIDQLRPRVAKVITFRPTQPGCKDLNDLTKGHHLTGAEFLAWVKGKLRRHPFTPKKPALTFLQFCKQAALGEGDRARAARLIVNDTHRPQGKKSPTHWRTYWRSTPDLTDADRDTLHALLDEWKSTA